MRKFMVAAVAALAIAVAGAVNHVEAAAPAGPQQVIVQPYPGGYYYSPTYYQPYTNYSPYYVPYTTYYNPYNTYWYGGYAPQYYYRTTWGWGLGRRWR